MSSEQSDLAEELGRWAYNKCLDHLMAEHQKISKIHNELGRRLAAAKQAIHGLSKLLDRQIPEEYQDQPRPDFSKHSGPKKPPQIPGKPNPVPGKPEPDPDKPPAVPGKPDPIPGVQTR